MSEIIVLSGHSNFNTGGVGTHLRVLNDELINQKIDHKVLLGKHKLFSLYSLIAKKMLPRSAYFHFNVQVSGLKNRLKNYVKDNTKVVDCHDFSAVVAAVKLKEENNYKYKIPENFILWDFFEISHCMSTLKCRDNSLFYQFLFSI